MTFTIEIKDTENPSFRRYIGIPPVKADEIHKSDDAAINFGRSVITRAETIDADKGHYWRIHKGHRFYVDTKESDAAMKEIIFDFLLHGEYEPQTVKLIEENVKEGDIAVDVGASIGVLTMHLARAVGHTGKVYAIEPTKNQFEYLKKNIHINGYDSTIIPLNVAAWNNDEKNFIARDLIANEKALEKMEYPHKIRVNLGSGTDFEGIALDSILPPKVDFIKMDVDGSEPNALKGLEKTIQNNPQLKMIIEYYPDYIKLMGLNPQDVIDFLDKYFTYEKIKGDLGSNEYWNYYCIRKND